MGVRPGAVAELLDAQREVTELVAAAQQEDGYLDSVVQLTTAAGGTTTWSWATSTTARAI